MFFCWIKVYFFYWICDLVIFGKLFDDNVLKFVEILIKNGLWIEGDCFINGDDFFLLVIVSFYVEKVGIYLIEKGVDVNLVGNFDGVSVLYWVLFCGWNIFVKKFLELGVDFSLKDKNYNCMLLYWVVYCLILNDEGNIWY